MAISVYPPASAGGLLQVTERITATQSWTAPSDVSQVEVWMAAGGGGGARYDGYNLNVYGGTGSVVHTFLDVTPGAAYTITIGAGGTDPHPLNGSGGTGGSSSFDTLLVVAGGSGGNYQDGRAYTSPYTIPAAPGLPNLAPVINFGDTNYGGMVSNSTAIANDFGLGGNGRCSNDDTGYLGATGGGGNGADAIANTGAGGCGAKNVSSAGGSGVCILKYWTAA